MNRFQAWHEIIYHAILGWITMYHNSPRKIVENFGLKWPKYKNQVLGGEAAMWSEQVGSYI